MRIKNLSAQDLKIPFKKSNGQQIVVTIHQNHFIYCEDHSIENKQIRIYERKGVIQILDGEKPEKLNFYHSYGSISHKEAIQIQKTPPTIIIEEDDEDEVIPAVEEVTITVSENDNDENEDNIEIEDLDVFTDEGEEGEEENSNKNENKPVKNKGGRPVGVKNKSKRGRKKSKKPVGRPSKNKKKVESDIILVNTNNESITPPESNNNKIPNNFE